MGKMVVSAFMALVLAVGLCPAAAMAAPQVESGELAPAAVSSAKISISSATVTVAACTYTGKALKPAVTVKRGGVTLAQGTDYTVAYSNNVYAGSLAGKVTITGKGSYTGTKTKSFTISRADISKKTVKLNKTSLTYNGKTQAPKVTISGLTEGVDFTVSGKKTNAGNHELTIKGKGNYTGTVKKGYEITKAANPMTFWMDSQTVKCSSLAKASKTIVRGYYLKFTNAAEGSCSYKKVSGSSKFAVNTSTGAISIKKGTAKGTYKIGVKVTAAGNGNYKAKTVTKKVTVKVV